MNENLVWRKSSRSGGTDGNCVAIAALPDGGRAIKDTKDPDGPVIRLSASQWSNLIKRLLGVQRRKARLLNATPVSSRAFLL
jgi:Domain of unknown function (DUF397)